MLSNLLTSAAKYNYKPEISEVLLYALIGFLVVFMGIAFLVFMVWLVGELIKKATTNAKEKAGKLVQELPKETLPVSADSNEVDEETIAVITAALMAFYQANNPKCEFTVKRIKRVRRNDYA